jgi:hypothetical protein
MKKTRVLIGAALLLSMACSKAIAQDGTVAAINSYETNTTHPASLGVIAGTTGFGLEGMAPLSSHWYLRAGFTFTPTIGFTKEGKIGTTRMEHHFKSNAAKLHLMVDYHLPVLKKMGFRLTGGVAWFITAQSNVNSVPLGNYYYGDINVNDERMGAIRSRVTRDGIAPYLGAGFLNLFSTSNINLSLDLGTYYSLADAKVRIRTSGYLTGNERNQEQLKENLKGYRWLPLLQLGLHFKF